MAVRYMGARAPYLFTDECNWCAGANNGTLSSTSFGSCVGLVLYGPRHLIGVVAHYAGSLGAPQHQQKVRNDTQEILRAICPVLPGIWNAWVFGGISLKDNDPSLRAMSMGQTKQLIDIVRQELKSNPYIPINVLASQRTVPEMQDGQYVGHLGVTLDLATGNVIWEEPKGESKNLTKQKSTRTWD